MGNLNTHSDLATKVRGGTPPQIYERVEEVEQLPQRVARRQSFLVVIALITAQYP